MRPANRLEIPNRRELENVTIEHKGAEYIVGVGPSAACPLEVWCDPPPKYTGSDQDFTARDSAVLISVALQHGVPLEAMRKSVSRVAISKTRTEPGSIIGRVLDTVAAEKARALQGRA